METLKFTITHKAKEQLQNTCKHGKTVKGNERYAQDDCLPWEVTRCQLCGKDMEWHLA